MQHPCGYMGTVKRTYFAGQFQKTGFKSPNFIPAPSYETPGSFLSVFEQEFKARVEVAMITGHTETTTYELQNDTQVRDYAERLVMSLGYNDAICTAMEFQWFNVAEELRFMQDDYRGVA